MITTSGITGIQNPKGPFHNSIHEFRVLTAFKDALPNAIRVLKAKGITDINARSDGSTPLHEAASEGHTDVVIALIAAGADVNAQNERGYTPLHWAADRGHTETVRALIDSGADVNLADNSGWTPLHPAASSGHTETVEP